MPPIGSRLTPKSVTQPDSSVPGLSNGIPSTGNIKEQNESYFAVRKTASYIIVYRLKAEKI